MQDFVCCSSRNARNRQWQFTYPPQRHREQVSAVVSGQRHWVPVLLVPACAHQPETKLQSVILIQPIDRPIGLLPAGWPGTINLIRARRITSLLRALPGDPPGASTGGAADHRKAPGTVPGPGLSHSRTGRSSYQFVYSLDIRFVIRCVMSLISIRLPDDLDAQLSREAEKSQRPKSELAREAIAQFLDRRERERFLGAIARAAQAARAEAEDPLAIAAEALPLDNEALLLGEGTQVQERPARYRAARRKP